MNSYSPKKLPDEAEETLYLHNKYLMKFPVLGADVVHLKRLFLQHNFLKDLSGLDQLPLLEHLDVSYNHLRVVAGLQHSHNLKELIVGRQITSHKYTLRIDPRSLETLRTCLERLDCASNKLDRIGDFAKLESLKQLDFSNNSVNNMQCLVEDLNLLKNLTSLDLRFNPVATKPYFMRNVAACLPFIDELNTKQITSAFRFKSKLRTMDSARSRKTSNTESIAQYVNRVCANLPITVSKDLIETVIQYNPDQDWT